MKRFVLSLCITGLTLAAGMGCGGSREALFAPGERTAYANTNTIALAPLNVAAKERPQAVVDAARYVEQVLAGRLEAAGFRVIPPQTTRAVFDTLALRTQNKYDASGDANPTVMAGLKAAAAREMAAQHGADAVLFPEVYLVRASIDGGTAKWDGVQEPVPVALENEAAETESRVADALAALSLAVEVVTADGETLYEARSGLEYVDVLKRTQPVPVLLREQVAKEGMLAEPRRTDRAVLLNLEVFNRKKAIAGTAESDG